MKRTSNQEVFASRAEWIKDWKRNNPGRPAPCSAKAAYRVADSKLAYLQLLTLTNGQTILVVELDLRDLKERAAQVRLPHFMTNHIQVILTYYDSISINLSLWITLLMKSSRHSQQPLRKFAR